MDLAVGGTSLYFVEHGEGLPVLVLHGAGVDHREAEACFEPGLDRPGLRRIYPDLPGMGRSPAPEALRSAADVLEVLLALVDVIAGTGPLLVVGHSAGAYYSDAIAARRPERVLGLALVCPLLAGTRDVPPHTPLVVDETLGDEGFRSYFVVQTAPMLDRYERFVVPALPLVDDAAAARIGERWQLDAAPSYPGPMLAVAGRQDSTVGSAASTDLLGTHPRATVAVLDGAGHALPHEQPAVLAALLGEWLDRAVR